MNLVKRLVYLLKSSRCGASPCCVAAMDQNYIVTVKNHFSLQQTRGYTQKGNTHWDVKLPLYFLENVLLLKKNSIFTPSSHFCTAPNDSKLSRDYFVQHWVADRKKPKLAGKSRRKSLKNNDLKQPPTVQSDTTILEPMSSEEDKVAPLLARSNLLITRDVEWANLVLGFEQENRYAVVDVAYPQSPVGFIRERSNLIARQLLRQRRPFVASITDGLGNELFTVRRPFWWITSSIYAEINGLVTGVVHRRWHLWRRIYDLYLGNKQFAVVENPGLWNWTFTLKDGDGNVLAQIDRDWRGFGFEIFTDAGQYVIRFGIANSGVEPVTGVEELSTARPLTLSERAIAVALAVSLDNDFFSRHGGWGFPFMAMED